MIYVWRVLILALITPRAFALDTLTYARKCQEKIGIPVPAFNCKDPQATILNASENGSKIPEGPARQDRCDSPSHGLSGCQSGTRILKYTDVIRRNGVEEKISTVVMCRRLPGEEGNAFGDVAVIQLNESKNLSCWFSKQGMGDSTNVPSPSNPNPRPNYWGASQPNMNCMSCHDGSTFIYSPFVAQIKGSKGGYTKRPGEANYSRGGGNEIPKSPLKVGPSCAFDMPGRNLNPQPQIKINLAAYEKRFGASDRTKALPTSCTECHYIGSGGMACGMARDALTGASLNSQRSAWAHRGVNSRWMPPQESSPYWPRNFWTTEDRRTSNTVTGLLPQAAIANAAEPVLDKIYSQQAEAYLEPAKRAIEHCCNNPNDREICGGRFTQTPSDACYGLNEASGTPKNPLTEDARGRNH